jgi:hypothetical protein
MMETDEDIIEVTGRMFDALYLVKQRRVGQP